MTEQEFPYDIPGMYKHVDRLHKVGNAVELKVFSSEMFATGTTVGRELSNYALDAAVAISLGLTEGDIK